MAGKLLKVCFIHPGGRDSAAAPDHVGDELASRERPDNVRVVPVPSAGRPRAAVERLKLWDNGRRCGSGSSTAIQRCNKR